MLNNNFSYTKRFLFHLQEDSYYVHDDTDTLFLFSPQKDFDICLGLFLMILTLYFFFFFRKILISVLGLFSAFIFFFFRKMLVSFKAFLCVFDIYLSLLYIEKNYKKYLFISLKNKL